VEQCSYPHGHFMSRQESEYKSGIRVANSKFETIEKHIPVRFVRLTAACSENLLPFIAFGPASLLFVLLFLDY
jgi:hypothetical protein